MDDHERALREDALVDAIADDCAAIRAMIAAEEARLMHRLADAWALAQQQTDRIASADSRRRDMPLRCIASQISVETHVHDRTVQTKMHDAWRMTTRFPATVTALEGGRISKAHADVILDTGDALDQDDVRGAFEAVVLEWAEAETVGRTRAYARQLAERLDPRTMADRHADAADDASVTVADLDNGMSQIIALVPTVLAHAILDRLTRQAAALKNTDHAARRRARRNARTATEAGGRTDAGADAGRIGTAADAAGDGAAGAAGDGVACAPALWDGPGAAPDPASSFDDRTVDQMRADLFVDMLLTGTPAIDPTCGDGPGVLGGIRAHVQITMPITTLTGVTQGGAEIDGKAPVDPDTARRLAGGNPIWDRVMFDPVTAVPVVVDRYRPTPAQQRFLGARDRHCRFPGCRMPARRCQIDHNDEHHDGGPTSRSNTANLCVRHHTMKTETEWTVRQRPGGRLEWSTPTGRRHTDHTPTVIFAPSPPF